MSRCRKRRRAMSWMMRAAPSSSERRTFGLKSAPDEEKRPLPLAREEREPKAAELGRTSPPEPICSENDAVDAGELALMIGVGVELAIDRYAALSWQRRGPRRMKASCPQVSTKRATDALVDRHHIIDARPY